MYYMCQHKASSFVGTECFQVRFKTLRNVDEVLVWLTCCRWALLCCKQVLLKALKQSMLACQLCLCLTQFCPCSLQLTYTYQRGLKLWPE